MIFLSLFLTLVILSSLEFKNINFSNKNIMLICSCFSLFRIALTGHIFFPLASVVSFFLMLPVFVKAFFLKKFIKQDFYRSELSHFLFALIIPELFFLIANKQWKLKSEINLYSPEGLSDTDEKLLLLTNTFWAVSCVFLFMGIDFVKTNFLLSFLPSAGFLYFKTSLEKVKFNWLKINNLFYINKAAHIQLDWKLVNDNLIQKLSKLSFLVFFLEFLSLIFLFPFNLQITLAFILSLCFFHVSVLILSGINFWKWVLSNLICILFIITSPAFVTDINIVISAYASFVMYFWYVSEIPIGLGWLDSPISRVFKIYLIDEHENKKRIYPHQIFPFDTIISQNRLQYLFPEEKYVTGCLGSIKLADVYPALCEISREKNKNEAIPIIKNFINNFGQQPNPAASNINTNKLLHFILRNQDSLEDNLLIRKLFSHIQTIQQEKVNCESNIEKPTKIMVTMERYFYSTKEEEFLIIDKKEKVFEVKNER